MAKKKATKAKTTNDIDDVLTAIRKKYDEGAVQVLSNGTVVQCNAISTGSITLDEAIGVGGIPRGRISELYGPESCLDGDMYVPYEVFSKDGKVRRNNKGGTIKRLYERFHGEIIDDQPSQGRHLQNNESDFYVKSVDDENSVKRNKIMDVVHAGEKNCYAVTVQAGNRDLSLTCTEAHKFLTPTGYKRMGDLKADDEVMVHVGARRKGRKLYTTRPSVCVKYHPGLPTKVVDGRYLYYRGQVSRMVYEAHMNDMPYEEYIMLLNSGDKKAIEACTFLPGDIHVHHEDEDFTNNAIENLRLVDPSEHGEIHAKDRLRNLSFVATSAKIINIARVGIRDTYDIKCAYPYNNYVANGIVVHNSGKTTLCLSCIANAQRAGGRAAFIDAEHAIDPRYAEILGVNLEDMILSQPDSGEQALDIAEMLIDSGKVSIVVVDSVAALTPKAELDGEMGDAHVGLQARLMGQAMRKLAGKVKRHDIALLFTNQIRMKVGVMFGNPETQPGGRALKFYASVRMDIRRTGTLKQSGDVPVGSRTKVTVRKNKVGPPLRVAEFDILYDYGINRPGEILDKALAMGIIKQSGAWFNYGDQRLGQGRGKACECIKGNEALGNELIALMEQTEYESPTQSSTEGEESPQDTDEEGNG